MTLLLGVNDNQVTTSSLPVIASFSKFLVLHLIFPFRPKMVCKIKEQFDGLINSGCGNTITLDQIIKWFTEVKLLDSKFTQDEVKSAFEKMKYVSVVK